MVRQQLESEFWLPLLPGPHNIPVGFQVTDVLSRAGINSQEVLLWNVPGQKYTQPDNLMLAFGFHAGVSALPLWSRRDETLLLKVANCNPQGNIKIILVTNGLTAQSSPTFQHQWRCNAALTLKRVSVCPPLQNAAHTPLAWLHRHWKQLGPKVTLCHSKYKFNSRLQLDFC